MSRAIRFLLGAWTAGNHRFNYKMKCSLCGVTHQQHNSGASDAAEICSLAKAEDRPFNDKERAALLKLRPKRCDYVVQKLQRLTARKRRLERQKRNRKPRASGGSRRLQAKRRKERAT